MLAHNLNWVREADAQENPVKPWPLQMDVTYRSSWCWAVANICLSYAKSGVILVWFWIKLHMPVSIKWTGAELCWARLKYKYKGSLKVGMQRGINSFYTKRRVDSWILSPVSAYSGCNVFSNYRWWMVSTLEGTYIVEMFQKSTKIS